MFTFNETQLARLASLRAWQDEGERRFEFWSRREAQAAAALTFGAALTAHGFRGGRALTDESRTVLLRSAAELAPNSNLSRRLFTSDPAGFDSRLRRLLSESLPLYDRLSGFLSQRGTGIQTASSLLCASAPETYPLLTRPSLRYLALTSVQKREALKDASDRYGFSLPESGSILPAQQMLALFIVYEQIRDLLRVKTYPEVDDALRVLSAAPTALIS